MLDTIAVRKSFTGCWLGRVPYGDALELQRNLVSRRLAGEAGDALLLLEHPPTITIGKSGKCDNVLAPGPELAEQGISVFCSDRGGDVTYHGPGQLVGYPIMDLRQRGKDLRRYVRDLEEVIIRTLGSFSIMGTRDASHPGVWIERQEIAAIGIRVSRWVTMHGFALNVRPNLEHFSLINPCGFSDRSATSMHEVLAEDIQMEVVVKELVYHFRYVFDVDLVVEYPRVGSVHE